MTSRRKSSDELRDLGDRIDESILDASDIEIDDELSTLGLDPKKVAAEFDALTQQAKELAGRMRLERAKNAVNAFRGNASLPNIDRDRLRAKLHTMQSSRNSGNENLMMAARKATKPSAADEEGVLEDLAQLEALDSDDSEAS